MDMRIKGTLIETNDKNKERMTKGSLLFVNKFVALSILFIPFVLLPIYKVLSADLYILPLNKNLNVSENLEIAVYVNSSDQAMNAVSFRISYPEDLLRFVSLSKSGTIINLWVQEPKGGGGEVIAEGVVLNPGFIGSKGKIVNITFKALKPGTANLRFVSGSILANDGFGTNILKDMKGGSYVIRERIFEKPKVSYLPTPNIFSPTHPDQEKWYNNNNPIFEWRVPEGVVEVRLLYDKNPDAIPTVSYSPPISRRELRNIPDGSYYFSVQFIGEGNQSNIGRFKFNIDTQPPLFEEFSLNIHDTNSIKFKIKAKDELSGIDKIDIYLDNNLTLSTSSEIFEDVIQNLMVGKHIFKAIIFDKAGNSLVKEEIINIPQPLTKKEIVVQKDYILYLILAFIFIFILILILVLILVIYLIKHRLDILHKEIKKEKLENIKTDLRKHLKETIQDLRHNISLLDEDPNLSQKEKQFYQELKNILEESEQKIEEKIKELK